MYPKESLWGGEIPFGIVKFSIPTGIYKGEGYGYVNDKILVKGKTERYGRERR